MRLIADTAGERLDAFLARSVPGLSRSAAQKLLDEGCVSLMGRPGKKNDRLNAGDWVELTVPEPKPVAPALSLSRGDVELTDDQIAILKALSDTEPMQVDDLTELVDIPTRRVLSALTVLEIDQYVVQHAGKHYTRAVTLTE